MGPSNKSKRRILPANYIQKTAADFVRWRREQGAPEEQVPEERSVQSDRVISKALMIWEDDGGAA